MRLPFIGKRRQDFKPSVRISHDPVRVENKPVEAPVVVKPETKPVTLPKPKEEPKPVILPKKVEEPQKKTEPLVIKEEPKVEPVVPVIAPEKPVSGEVVSAETEEKKESIKQEISATVVTEKEEPKEENFKRHKNNYQQKSSVTTAVTLNDKKADNVKNNKEEK